jgi:hypothetical protein
MHPPKSIHIAGREAESFEYMTFRFGRPTQEKFRGTD